ncbi:hypothetical protein [Mycobacterium sp. DL99]|uniref:oxidoreductase n=1 Tax=Mycobacterium sp. DL99 TaxID=2528957 RepID=UPI0010821BCB|nr:hypothetical protein [Mycobacterium sp. DL99]
MTPSLFEPLTIRGVSFRNRVWVSPMCQYMCLEGDGMPHDWHLVNAGTYAAGGAGLVMVEATGISPEARITAECAGIWNDAQRDRWIRVVDFVHSQGAQAGIQLAHTESIAAVTVWIPIRHRGDHARPICASRRQGAMGHGFMCSR